MAVNFSTITTLDVTVMAIILKGVQNWDLSDDAGNVVALNGDSQLNVEDIFVDNRQLNLSIQLSDPQLVLAVAALAVGEVGNTVLRFQKRKSTDGSAVGAAQAVTILASIITNVPSSVPHEGLSSATLTIQAAAPGGAALYSVAAV